MISLDSCHRAANVYPSWKFSIPTHRHTANPGGAKARGVSTRKFSKIFLLLAALLSRVDFLVGSYNTYGINRDDASVLLHSSPFNWYNICHTTNTPVWRETYTKRTQLVPWLRTVVCGSHKGWSHREIEHSVKGNVEVTIEKT